MMIYVAGVTGGRNYSPSASEMAQFVSVVRAHQIRLVVTGNCPKGVDHVVRSWCATHGVPYAGFDPWWSYYGNRAGPKRNGWMLDALAQMRDGAMLIAFPGGAGTADCIRQAQARFLPVFMIEKDRYYLKPFES